MEMRNSSFICESLVAEMLNLVWKRCATLCFQDLLLTQQLSNMWVLPFYEEGKRETCLSGFEGLAHEVSYYAVEALLKEQAP